LRMKARLFHDSVSFLCRTMTDQANCVARLSGGEPTFGSNTAVFAAITKAAIQESALSRLSENMEMKVLEPIRVNLEIIDEVKARAYQREQLLKKRTQKNQSGASELNSLTAHLFEELSALKQHRFDIIRGVFEGLKLIQRRFFGDCVRTLESPDIDTTYLRPDLSPSRDVVFPSDQARASPLVLDSSLENKSTSPTINIASNESRSASPMVRTATPSTPVKREVLVATPLVSSFNPMADQINVHDAPAFSRFGNRNGNYEEERPPVKPPTPSKSSSPTKGLEKAKSPMSTAQNFGINEDDDSEFDTV